MIWHRTEINAVLEELNTDKEHGLASAEANARLAKHGPNELVEKYFGNYYRSLGQEYHEMGKEWFKKAIHKHYSYKITNLNTSVLSVTPAR